MRKQILLQILLIALLLPLLLVACRRDEDPTPTTAPTAMAPDGEDATQPAPTATRPGTEPDTAAPTPTATPEPATANAIDPADIDWSPQVVSSSPAPGQETTLDGAITIRFDQPMDQETVEAAFSVRASGDDGAVAGQFEWPRPDTLTFTPQSRLERKQGYQVVIDTAARGRNGQQLDTPVNLTFETVGFLDVSQTLPADGSEDIALDATITVLFNRSVVPLVSTAQQADLPQPLVFDPPVEGSGEWTSTSIYRFMPDEPLAGATTYDVTIPAGLEDVTGGVLEADFSWSFTTVSPSVASIMPENGAQNVDPTTPITITFNTIMDEASTEAALSLQPSLPLAFTWADEGRTVTITPDSRLALETRYVLRVGTAALAANGAASLDRETTSAFTTVPFPAVSRTSPANGEQAQSFQRGVYIEFASPMRQDTLRDQIQIDPEPDDVEYYLGGPAAEQTQFVNLDFTLVPNAEYVITIPATAADPYGNTLGEPYTWRFTAAPAPAIASFNLPGNVAQLSNAVPTNVDIIYRGVSALDVSLYDLGLPLNLLGEPYRVNEYSPAGQPQRTWTLDVNAEDGSADSRTLELADGDTLRPGIYYLRLSAPELRQDTQYWQNQRQTLIVADTNLVVKEMVDAVYVWATDLGSGDPAGGRTLTFYQRNGVEIDTATTDEDGFARIDYTPVEGYLEGVFVVSNAPDQAGFGVGNSTWKAGTDPWQFNVESTGSLAQPEFAYIYTDRPIYRPGDTVHYRGILRDNNYARYGLPGRDSVTVNAEFFSFYEASDQVDYSVELPLDEMGTFSGEFEIPDDASLGQYRLFLANEGDVQDGSRSFQVAEYRTPEFQVSVTPAEDEVLRGETVDVTIEASYFFGGAAADLAVEYNVFEHQYRLPWDGPYYSFVDDDTFTFYGSDQQYGPGYFGNGIMAGTGRTDGDGRLTITLPTSLLAEAGDGSRVVTVEATVQDLTNFPVSAHGQVIMHGAATYVGVKPTEYINAAGQDMTVDLITVDWDGNPVPDGDVEVVFYERDYEYIPDEFGPFGRFEPVDTEVDRTTVTTDGEGEAQAGFVPENGGTYRAVATVTDPAGDTLSSGTLFWVTDSDFVGWRTSPDAKRMDLTPDERSYEVGDTARILVQSPFAGPVNAWLTIERGSLIEQRLVTLESNSAVVEVPITEALSPNAFVTIVAVRGAGGDGQFADIRLGLTELIVPPQHFTLNVDLTPRSDVLAPGETVTYDIQVTNYAGSPVQADLSLALVDLAVLTLADDNAPPIANAFYARQPYRSEVGSGLFITGEGLEVKIPEEVLGRGGGGGDGTAALSAAALEEEDVRRDFPDTAFWRASISTNADGVATVDIPLPDSLTTWRLSSKAVTEDSLVGQTTVDIRTTLPLLIRPITPRFFTVNDVVQIGAIVNNNTDESLDVVVSLEAMGLSIAGDAEQTVSVPAGGQQRVRWDVTVEDVSFADLTFRAGGGEYSDATKPTFGVGPNQLIPVYRYDAEDVVGTFGVLDESGRRVEAVLLPPEIDTRRGSIEATLNPSLAAALTDALTYIDAEYDGVPECAPGVINQMLPNLVTVRALRELELADAALESRLDGLVGQDIGRLETLQRSDGGWTWCFGNETDEYLTAYVLFGLVKAQQAGYDLGTIDLDNAAGVLTIADPDELGNRSEVNRQAWFLYVLAEAGEADVADLDALFDEDRELLDPYAAAYLALAYEVLGTGAETQQALLSDLNNSAIASATGAHWEDAERDWFNLNSDIRGTAVVIDALSRIDPDNALGPQAVRWLMVARTAGHWPTSFETAWSILALTDWMVAAGELEADFDYQVNVNGVAVENGRFDASNVMASTEFSVMTRNLLEEDVNFFDVQRGEGPGRLYYTLHLDAFVNAESVSAVSRGITVQRVYYDAECDPAERECAPITEIAAGQRVRVELTIVAPNDLTYAVVEDPLPAGAEAVDPGLRTSASGLGGEVERTDREYRYGYWGWWFFNRIEYRDEKVVFYSNFLPAGTYQYTYFLETPIPGRFQVMPTIAYEEFFPEVFGRSDGMAFTITE